jgi:trigger factor
VKSSVEALEGNKVKLYVEVEEDEFDRDIDKAFKVIAKEVKLPGFRNGKVPRRVLEARIGLGPAREQALRDAVPEYLAKAVREHDIDLVATPEVEITDGQEEGPVEFDATCEIRPVITVPGYGGLRVELPRLDVDDEAIADAQQTELQRHGSLESVDRPAESGDWVTLDLNVTRDGEELVGLQTEDWSYEIGQGWVAEDFDEHLVGVSAGDELEFAATPKGTDEPADFKVVVTAVQETAVPELTDEFVSENIADFDTVDAWVEDLAESLAESKLNEARQLVGGKVSDALAELVEEEPPESMVSNDLNQRVQNTVQQFAAQGIDFEQWLQATGQQPDQFVESMREPAQQGVKVDLALRAVAEAEAIEVEGNELEMEYARMAMQYGQKSKDIRKAYEQNDMVPELIAQIRKQKAMDWLVHHVDFVDEDGQAIDRDTLLGHSHDEHGDHVSDEDVDDDDVVDAVVEEAASDDTSEEDKA